MLYTLFILRLLYCSLYRKYTLAFPKQRVKRHSLNTILKQIMIQMNKYATKIKITVCGLKT